MTRNHNIFVDHDFLVRYNITCKPIKIEEFAYGRFMYQVISKYPDL